MLGTIGVIEMTLGRDRGRRGEGVKNPTSRQHQPLRGVPNCSVCAPRKAQRPGTRGKMSGHRETHPRPSLYPPPRSVGEVWALTVQSQLSPRDGHRTGSGNEPRAACQEQDIAQQVKSRALGPLVGQACWQFSPRGGRSCPTSWAFIHLVLTIPSRHTSCWISLPTQYLVCVPLVPPGGP